MEPTIRQWLVALEARTPEGNVVEVGEVRRLLTLLHVYRASGLHSSDGYVVQLRVDAATASEALAEALDVWEEAHRSSPLIGAPLVRAEVLTPEEFERECALFDFDGHTMEGATSFSAVSIEPEPLLRALYDPFTGLANASLFRLYLEQEISACGNAQTLGVVRLDLDSFGEISGSFGSVVVDQVLSNVAVRLMAIGKPGDRVARLGSDQFGVVLRRSSEEEVIEVAQRMLGEIQRPMREFAGRLELTASAGTAFASLGATTDDLLEKSAVALLAAKTAGKARHVVFCSSLPRAGLERLHAEVLDMPDGFASLGIIDVAAALAETATSLEIAALPVIQQLSIHFGWPLGVLWARPQGSHRLSPVAEWHSPCDADLAPLAAKAMARQSAPMARPWNLALEQATHVWKTALTPIDDWGRAALAAGIRTSIAVPIRSGADIPAVFELFSRREGPSCGLVMTELRAIASLLGRVVERTRATSALEESDERLRSILAFADLGTPHGSFSRLDVSDLEVQSAHDAHTASRALSAPRRALDRECDRRR